MTKVVFGVPSEDQLDNLQQQVDALTVRAEQAESANNRLRDALKQLVHAATGLNVSSGLGLEASQQLCYAREKAAAVLGALRP